MNSELHDLIREKCRDLERGDDEETDIETQLLRAADEGQHEVILVLFQILNNQLSAQAVLQGENLSLQRKLHTNV